MSDDKLRALARQALDTLPARADAQQTQGAEDERAAFEAWALRTIATDDDLKRGRLTGYASQELNYLWRGWSAHATTQQTAVPLTPFNGAQIQRLYDNSPEIHKDVKSFAAFARVLCLAEAAHGITAKDGDE